MFIFNIDLYIYNLINIMWYIIIILTLVYWSLYKIIKEYSWGYFNKQNSLLNSTLIIKRKTLYKMQNSNSLLEFFYIVTVKCLKFLIKKVLIKVIKK